MEQSDLNNIYVPLTVPESRKEQYIQAIRDAEQTETDYLLFIRDDTKEPLTPITIDFMYKIISINENHEKNTIIEFRDYSGISYKQQVNVRVYKQDDPAVKTDIESPYILRQPIDNWIHLLFRFNASNKTWEAFYNGYRWFMLRNSSKFSPATINYIKVYTKIPYLEGGDFQAYVANLTISRTIKDIIFFPIYPRDYGPILIHPPIKPPKHTIIYPGYGGDLGGIGWGTGGGGSGGGFIRYPGRYGGRIYRGWGRGGAGGYLPRFPHYGGYCFRGWSGGRLYVCRYHYRWRYNGGYIGIGHVVRYPGRYGGKIYRGWSGGRLYVCRYHYRWRYNGGYIRIGRIVRYPRYYRVYYYSVWRKYGRYYRTCYINYGYILIYWKFRYYRTYLPYFGHYRRIYLNWRVVTTYKVKKTYKVNTIKYINNVHNIILLYPARMPVDIWESDYDKYFKQDYVYHTFIYGGEYVKYYYNSPQAIYNGGYWNDIPSLGPASDTHNGIMTFRRGTVLGKNYYQDLTITAWLYIKYTKNENGFVNIYNFIGAHGILRLCFNGTNFRIYRNNSYWDLNTKVNLNAWTHFAFSYHYTSPASNHSNLRIFINGIRVLTLTYITFTVKDMLIFTRSLTSPIQFYHTGICIKINSYYINNFSISSYLYPPYELLPGQSGYPIYPSLPTAPKSSTIFKYPTTDGKYTSNNIYSLYYIGPNLVKELNDGNNYIYPVISTNSKTTVTKINFTNSKTYQSPYLYTLEYWLYLTEDYTALTKSDSMYNNYDYFILLAGGNGIYLAYHKKGNLNFSWAKVFKLDLQNKWNHIAMTCENKTKFALFVNGNKIYNQNKSSEIFVIDQLFMSLNKLKDSGNSKNNISSIEMYDYIRYTNNFDYNLLYSKPFEEINEEE